MPKVAIVVPTYNCDRDFFKRCLVSLKSQTVPLEMLHVVIVDDASAEPVTSSIISECLASTPFEVIRHEQNLGLHEARRTGAVFAKDVLHADFVIFVDCDDSLPRRAIENLTKSIGTRSEIILGRTLEIHSDPFQISISRGREESISGRRAIEDQILKRSFSVVGGLFPVRFVSEALDFDWRGRHEDILEMTRFVAVAGSVKQIESVTYFYWRRNGSLSSPEGILEENLIGIARSTAAAIDFLRVRGEINSRLGRAFAERMLRIVGLRIKRSQNSADITLERFITHFDSSMQLHLRQHAGSLTSSIQPLGGNQTHEDNVAELGTLALFDDELALALLLRGRDVFVCMVDYHVSIAKELIRYLPGAVILDLSHALLGGSRASSGARASRQVTPTTVPSSAGFLMLARTVYLLNDYTPEIELAQELRSAFGKPTFSIMEGPSDLKRQLSQVSAHQVPWVQSRIPYNFGDSVLTAGSEFNSLVGKPAYTLGQVLLEKQIHGTTHSVPVPIGRILVNVNFSYGVGEVLQKNYVDTVSAAASQIGLPCLFSKHPASAAMVSAERLTEHAIDEELGPGDVLVTRFSTVIFTALTRGVPVVFFSPNEKSVLDPSGAYEIANDEAELRLALAKIVRKPPTGEQVRARSANFLLKYAGVQANRMEVGPRFNDFVSGVGSQALSADDDALIVHAFWNYGLKQRPIPNYFSAGNRRLENKWAGTKGAFARTVSRWLTPYPGAWIRAKRIGERLGL